MKKRYIVLTENTVTELADEVNKKVKEFYIPVGGLVVENGWYYQSMFLPEEYAEEEPDPGYGSRY